MNTRFIILKCKPSFRSVQLTLAHASHLTFNDEGRAVLDVASIETALAARRGSVIDWADDTGPRPKLKPTTPDAPPPLGVVRGIKVPTPRSRPQRP